MYLGIFLIFRFIVGRQASSIGIADLLVIVIIADAAQNAFAKDYKSIPEGVTLVLTIIFWNFALDWLAYRSTFFAWLANPAAAAAGQGRQDAAPEHATGTDHRGRIDEPGAPAGDRQDRRGEDRPVSKATARSAS